MRKSTIEKYFKAMQELYYRIEVLKENTLSLDKFCKEKVISNITTRTLKKLNIVCNNSSLREQPNLKWVGEKPSVKMAKLICKENNDYTLKNQKYIKIPVNKYKELLVDLKNLTGQLERITIQSTSD